MRTRVLMGLVVVAAVYACVQLWPEFAARQPTQSPHYTIKTTASSTQTAQVAAAVENLHTQYLAFFSIAPAPHAPKLRLTLYKDRDEFRQKNPDAQWAEAFYRTPDCHAYFAADESNPYHWMIHEATHQLNHEVAHFPASKWINEGLATYFGTSTIAQGALKPGQIDEHTYPVWVVAKLSLTGELQRDIERGKVIALRALISGTGGPDINEKFNAYYVGYWSLTHFLFHVEHGKYAHAFRQLIAAGGSVEDFEKLIGPIERIEAEWYVYLKQQVATFKTV